MIDILLGTGFEEIEALATADILRRAQLPVQLVGIGGDIISGAHGICVAADIRIHDINLDAMEMLVLPGGLGGVQSIENSEEAMAAIQFAREKDRYLAAICAAPTILGKRGWIDGKNAVCYPGMEGDMGKAIVHPEQETVVDGKLITGRAPGASFAFGLRLISVLRGQQAPVEIAHYLVYEPGN